MDLSAMMKQAKKIQERLAKVQEELSEKEVEASAGGGMVTAVANGKQELLAVRISPEVVDSHDIPMLEDLVTAAVNAALHSSKRLMQEEISRITGGVKIPGINV